MRPFLILLILPLLLLGSTNAADAPLVPSVTLDYGACNGFTSSPATASTITFSMPGGAHLITHVGRLGNVLVTCVK